MNSVAINFQLLGRREEKTQVVSFWRSAFAGPADGNHLIHLNPLTSYPISDELMHYGLIIAALQVV